jgi:hypothetical protein
MFSEEKTRSIGILLSLKETVAIWTYNEILAALGCT